MHTVKLHVSPGMSSVNHDGEEYEVKDGTVEVSAKVAAHLLAHGGGGFATSKFEAPKEPVPIISAEQHGDLAARVDAHGAQLDELRDSHVDAAEHEELCAKVTAQGEMIEELKKQLDAVRSDIEALRKKK